MPLRPLQFAQLNFLLFLLLLCGDIHPNPGPTPRPAGDPTITLINDHLRLLNWNVRGIDCKLQSLPEFFPLHNVHVAILTKTRRTLSHASLSTSTHLDGYTFHFLSHIDSTAASYFLAPHLCKWGVCIAIKDALAFQPARVPRHFESRLLQGALTLRGSAHSTIVLHILAIYAPANQQQKATFWLNLTNYLKTFAPPILSEPTQHLLLGGDWNSYINPSRDIVRSPSLVTPPPNNANASDGQHNTFFCRFIEELRDDSIHLFDPLSSQQYTAPLYYTYANANFTYSGSILDKIFTSFSAHHMEPTIVLDWDQYNLVGASDHRATLLSISLASLGQGWIEYPSVPFRSPPLINIDKFKSLDPSLNASQIASWKTGLPQSFATILTSASDPKPQSDISISNDVLSDMYGHLLALCVDIPRSLIAPSVQSQHKYNIYKSSEAGQAQAIVVWLRRYRVALRHFHDAHSWGHRNLTKGPRNTVRRIYHDFESNSMLCTHLFVLLPLQPRSIWDLTSWQTAWDRTAELQHTWSRRLTEALRTAKQSWLVHRREHAYASPPNSCERRALHFVHKTASTSLPALMKDPTNSNRLVTGVEVNDLWGSSAAAAKPSTMQVEQPKDSVSAPCLQPVIWASLRATLKSREADTMAPITRSDLQNFLQHTSRSSPGLDGVQYNVLQFLCYDENLLDLNVETIILLFSQYSSPPQKVAA
jgi:hypothetical protein